MSGWWQNLCIFVTGIASGLALPAQGQRCRVPCVSMLQAPLPQCFLGSLAPNFFWKPQGLLARFFAHHSHQLSWDHISIWPDCLTRIPSKTNADT